MSQVCAKCQSSDLVVVKVFVGYWRKECQRCGSTGPFGPPSKDSA